MNHPCNHHSCIENYHGECYGEGCRLNPMPEPSELSTHYLYDDSVPFAEDEDGGEVNNGTSN